MPIRQPKTSVLMIEIDFQSGVPPTRGEAKRVVLKLLNSMKVGDNVRIYNIKSKVSVQYYVSIMNSATDKYYKSCSLKDERGGLLITRTQ